MSEQEYAYPFDPTGQLDSNLIVSERHSINPPDYTDFYFVVPLVGPFFKENLVIRHWPSGRELIDGVDYALGYHFLSASRATANPVYGAITFYDYNMTGVVEITYQTLGGPWTIDETKAAQMLSDVVSNPRITTWEQVVEMPATFPVIDHEWDLVDLVGAGEVVEKLDLIEQAIIQKADESAGGGVSHINDESNPHNTTKDQVGLGLVSNYPPASVTEGIEGDLNDRYMTPRRVKEAISAQVNNDFRSHEADVENPHSVTQAQVGLGNVSNYATADAATARDGVSATHFMTPAGSRELVLALVGGNVPDHIANTNNPHGVTAAQVGLGSVPNFPMASNAVAQAATSPDYLMSPYHTRLLVDEVIVGPFSDHVSNADNPHQVTKGQVGLGNVENYVTAGDLVARDATSQSHYMTPYATRLTVDELVGETVSLHIGDRDNPHQVTKAQVGLGSVENLPLATQLDALDGTSNARYMTPVRVKDMIDASVGGAALDHIAAEDNPHNVSKAQVGLGNVPNYAVATSSQAIGGTSDTLFMTPAKVAAFVSNGITVELGNHVGDTENPHGVTATQVGLGNVANYRMATETESRSGLNNDLYMSPMGVKQSVDSYITDSVGNLPNRLNELETTQEGLVTDTSTHVSNLNNPHEVTAQQLGVYESGEVDLLLDEKLGITARAADTERFDGLTRAELVGSIETEAAGTYVTQEEVTVLSNNLSTSFEDAMWGLMGNNVIRLEEGDLTTVFTQATDIVHAIEGGETNRWFAGGTGGLLAKSTDNLLSWTAVSLGITDDITTIAYVGGTQWYLATAAGEIYGSADNGDAWALVDLGDTTANPLFAVHSIVALADGTLLAIGDNAMRVSTDGGTVWGQVVDLASVSGVNDAAAISDNTLYLATATGLHTWTEAAGLALVPEVDNTVPLVAVETDQDDHILAVSELGLHHRYSPVNGAWQVLVHEQTVKTLSISADGLWAAIAEDNVVWRSIDGGRFWGRVPTSPTNVPLATIGSSGAGWAVAGEGGTLYISVD